MRLEKNVCAVGAKLFLTHQKPSRPLQLTQMEGLEVFSLKAGGDSELDLKKKKDRSLFLRSLSISVSPFLNNSMLRCCSAWIWLRNLFTQLTLKTAYAQRQYKGHGSHPRDIYKKCASPYISDDRACEERCSRLPWYYTPQSREALMKTSHLRRQSRGSSLAGITELSAAK